MALFDTDEFMAPLRHPSWAEMLEDLLQSQAAASSRRRKKPETVAAFSFRHAYYSSQPPSPPQWKLIQATANITDRVVAFIHKNEIQLLFSK